MNDLDRNPVQRPRLHPLVATAAIAVIVLSAVGVTTLVMNRSNAQPSPYDAPRAEASLPAATGSAARTPATVYDAPAAPAGVDRSTSGPVTPVDRSASGPVTPVYDAPPPVAQAAAPVCRDCGVIDSIREIRVEGRGTGVGAVGGAVVGGLLGNMVGAGRGKALATVAGAVGGGLGGNAIEKNVRSETEHQMVVRLDHGGTRTFTQSSPFPYRQGERVRIVAGHVEHA